MLLLLPATAFPQAIYDVSCDNVARIRIFRLKADKWKIESYGGYFHLLVLDLKPDAAKDFGRLLHATPTLDLQLKGIHYHPKNLILTANGGPLRDDIPGLTGMSEQGILLTIFLKEDAFDTARSVCPALVPTKVLLDGQWE
ncbi:MAG: hypothetical protein AB9900_06895 [Humidesulfovibrio sp.]